jgi:hypothetical protein
MLARGCGFGFAVATFSYHMRQRLSLTTDKIASRNSGRIQENIDVQQQQQ